MANVADLTKAEVSAQISDTALKTWFDTAPDYDASFGTAELLIKLVQSCYRAQVVKNAAEAPAAGEALNAYPAPVAGTVSFDAATGLQVFEQSITVNAVSAVDSNLTSPARV